MLHPVAVYFSLSKKIRFKVHLHAKRGSVLKMYTREIFCQLLERWRSRWESEQLLCTISPIFPMSEFVETAGLTRQDMLKGNMFFSP